MSSSKKSKIVVVLLLIIAVGGYLAYSYAYKPHTEISDMEVSFTGDASDFLNDIRSNPEAWTQGEKVVQLTGNVSATDEKGVTINQSVYFQLAEGTSTASFSKGQQTTLKGRIIGYDDLLEELKLDKAVIVK